MKEKQYQVEYSEGEGVITIMITGPTSGRTATLSPRK